MGVIANRPTEIAMTKIAILADFFPPASRAGGPVRTLHAMVSQTTSTASIAIFTSGHDLDDESPLPVPLDEWVNHPPARIWYRGKGLRCYYQMQLSIRNFRPDLLYLNSFFSTPSAIVPLVLHRLRFYGNAKAIIAPRGELDAGALKTRQTKKLLFIHALKLLLLPTIKAWHASTADEAESIRRLFPEATVLKHANETPLPNQATTNPLSQRERKVLFLSRVAPKKGLHTLIQAVALSKRDIHLEIVGDGKDGDAEYLRYCQGLARDAPPHVRVTFLGHRDISDPQSFFASYQLAVLPTLGENFGHVIAESLSAGTPILVAPTTPWTSTLERLGLVVASFDPEEWTKSIECLMSLSDQEFLRLSEQIASEYEAWQIHQHARPNFLNVLSELHTMNRI